MKRGRPERATDSECVGQGGSPRGEGDSWKQSCAQRGGMLRGTRWPVAAPLRAHGGLCRPLGLVRSRGACWGGQRHPVGPAVDSAVVLAAKHSAGWIAQDSGLTATVHGLHCLPPTKIIILACFSYSQLRCSSFSI